MQDQTFTDPDQLMNAEQAAEYLRHCSHTLANWRSLRRGPRYVRVGRRVMYRLSSLRDWLAAHEVDPAALPPERPGEPEPIGNINARLMAKLERERRR